MELIAGSFLLIVVSLFAHIIDYTRQLVEMRGRGDREAEAAGRDSRISATRAAAFSYGSMPRCPLGAPQRPRQPSTSGTAP